MKTDIGFDDFGIRECEESLDIFDYYPSADGRYCKVDPWESEGSCRGASTNTDSHIIVVDTDNHSVKGKESIVVTTGRKEKAKGPLGSFIVLAEWYRNEGYEWHIKDVKSALVDGEIIKADTFYMLKDGEFTEVE